MPHPLLHHRGLPRPPLRRRGGRGHRLHQALRQVHRQDEEDRARFHVGLDAGGDRRIHGAAARHLRRQHHQLRGQVSHQVLQELKIVGMRVGCVIEVSVFRDFGFKHFSV